MRHKWVISFIVAVLLCSSGCKKLVEVDPPDDWLVSGVIFSSDSMASAAVTGLYINIMGQTKYFLNGAMSLFPGLSADELERIPTLNNEDQFTLNSLLPSNALVGNNIWKAAYSYLYQCNIILEKLSKSQQVSEVAKARLAGEVQFVRALCYTYLVNLFGNVPLVISSSATINAVLPRSPVDSVYRLITDDLLAAYTVLPDATANVRPTKMACQALLARIYLYRREWDKAVEAATMVINSGKYTMETDLGRVFLAASAETIFQWAPVLQAINSSEGNFFNPSSPSGRPFYKVREDLMRAFEPNDLRKNHWTKEVPPNPSLPTFTYPHKYKVYASTAPATEYNIVLRLAEQYLIRAEAAAQQNDIIQAVADINVIRDRAGVPLLPNTAEKAECLVAIEKERRIELFAEWGHRWIDLKRWQRVDTVLRMVKGANWQQTDRLYPIPFLEIEADPNLTQNEGY